MSNDKFERKSRNFGLDLMRATAIILVLGSHAYHIIASRIPKSISFITLPDGVDLFFVLSGFLIGGIWIDLLGRTGMTHFDRIRLFLKRRWFRTIPVYFLIILFLFILRFFHSHFSFHFPWKYFLLIQNLSKSEWDPYFFYPEAWSLSIEEWFYVLLPFCSCLILLVLNNEKYSMLLFILIILIVPFILRILFVKNHALISLDSWNRNIRHITIYRFDMIGFGVFGSWLKFFYRGLWIKLRKYKWIGVLFILIAFVSYHIQLFVFFLPLFYFTLVGFGLLLLLPSIEGARSNNKVFVNVITFLSMISYSIYLLNRTLILKYMFSPFSSYFEKSTMYALVFYVLFYCITISMSILFYKWIEKPIVDLRNRM